jgi:hypothetical protein
MAYNQFTLKQLREEYQLDIMGQSALFADVPPAVVPDWLRETLARQVDVALRSGSEKARSEYIVAPILLAVYEQIRDHANLFSGVEFEVDPARGLAGFCDFLFTLAPHAIDIQAPIVSIVEAKKDDIPKGIPQCLAELVAAQIFNASAGKPIETLYGVITTGEIWKFLRLHGTSATIDIDDYFLNQPEKIIGIILSMLR